MALAIPLALLTALAPSLQEEVRGKGLGDGIDQRIPLPREVAWEEGLVLRVRVPVARRRKEFMTTVSFPEERIETAITGWAEGTISATAKKGLLFLRLPERADGYVNVIGGSGTHYLLDVRGVEPEAKKGYDAYLKIKRTLPLASKETGLRKSPRPLGSIELIRAMRLGRKPPGSRILRANREVAHESERIRLLLRDRLMAHSLMPGEEKKILELLGSFSTHREELKDRDYASLTKALGDIDPGSAGPGSYVFTHLEAAKELVLLAEKAAGRSETTGPARAELALLGLSVDAESALGTVLAAEGDDVLLFTPFFARLLGDDVLADVGTVAARAGKEGGSAIPSANAFSRVATRTASLRAARKEVLALFPYLEKDLDRVAREAEALKLLLDRKYAAVLLDFEGTASYPVAGTLLSRGFEKSLASSSVDLIAGTGWFDWKWELRPKVETLEERLRYWKLSPADGTHTLSSTSQTRTLIMNEPADRLPEGVLLRAAFTPHAGNSESSAWKVHLRLNGGVDLALYINIREVSVFETSLDQATTPKLLGKAPLPPLSPESEGYRSLALIPTQTSLFLFSDGRPVLRVGGPEALIPRHLSISVTEGILVLKSIRVRR